MSSTGPLDLSVVAATALLEDCARSTMALSDIARTAAGHLSEADQRSVRGAVHDAITIVNEQIAEKIYEAHPQLRPGWTSPAAPQA